MQIKTIMRHHNTLNGLFKLKKTDHMECSGLCGITGTLRHIWQKCICYKYFGKAFEYF